MDDEAERIIKLSSLTPRQRQVLELIGQNLNNEEIAQRLSISNPGVMYHIMEIYGRLGISEPTRHRKVARNIRQRELAAYAHALRLLAQGKTSQDQSLLARSSVRGEHANIDDEEFVTEGLISTHEDEPPPEVLADAQVAREEHANIDDEEFVTEGLISTHEDEPPPEVFAIIRVIEAVIEDGYGSNKRSPMLFLSRNTWLLRLLVGFFLLFIFITIAMIFGITADDVNIAPEATVIASSYHIDTANIPDCFIPRNAVDGNILSRGRCVEWASNNDEKGVWINLEFDAPRKIRKIILYDRQNPDDNVLHGKLDFIDDTDRIISSIPVRELLNNGEPVEISLPHTVIAKRVKFTVDSYVGPFVGLSEIQIF